MAAILFLLFVSISFLVVRIGAVALELTGLPWSQAKFQALSAFSNSGFTTRESERILNNPARRRIASFLIVLGNAGFITMIGAFVSSLNEQELTRSLANIFLIILGFAALLWISRRSVIHVKLRSVVKDWLLKNSDFDIALPEELLHLERGYTLTSITISEKFHALGHKLHNLQFKQNEMQIIAIERSSEFMPIPRGTQTLEAGDKIIVYGRKKKVREFFKSSEVKPLTISEKQG